MTTGFLVLRVSTLTKRCTGIGSSTEKTERYCAQELLIEARRLEFGQPTINKVIPIRKQNSRTHDLVQPDDLALDFIAGVFASCLEFFTKFSRK